MDWVQKRRAHKSAIAALLSGIMLATLSGIPAVQAQTNEMSDSSHRISLNVYDMELSKVVQLLMRESKQNIVIRDASKMQNKVSATLSDMPLGNILKYVVEGAGCTLSQDANGVYVIDSAQTQSAVGAPLTEGMTSHSRALDDSTYTAHRDMKVESIKLHNTGATDMMWLLGLYEFKDAPKIEKSSFKPGVYIQKSDGELKPVLVPRNGTPPMTESMRTDGSYAERTPGVQDEALQFQGSTGGYSAPIGGYRGGASGGTPPGMPGGRTGSPGSSTSGGSGLVPEGIDFIMPYELDNSLIVKGSEEGIEELKSFINKLDIAPKQIMIKAEFVEIDTTASKALGINWSLERLGTSVSTQFNTPGSVTVGFANGNVMATLKAELSEQKAKLVNAPLISTLNNVPGVIRIGTIVPFLNSQIIYNSQGNPSTVTMPDFLPIQSELMVLPRVNSADNSITVYMQPTISDSPGSVDTPNGKIPIQSQQQIQTIRRVGNGETIVLGGIIRKSNSVNTNKIPLLGDLPIVGPLFRSSNTDTNDKELLIFLTPNIIPERTLAGTGVGVTP